MHITAEDRAYLIKSIKAGDAMLVLGAGASASSANARGEPIKLGRSLAALLAEEAGMSYEGETLIEVLGAIKGRIFSSVKLNEILSREYRNCRPSSELSDLFSYA